MRLIGWWGRALRGRPGVGLAVAVVVLVGATLLIRDVVAPAPVTSPAPRAFPTATGSPARSPAGCAGVVAWVCQDFDATPAGKVPLGWRPAGPGAVTAAQARSGRHALEAGVIARGPRAITLDLRWLGTKAGEQWGRIFFKVAAPAPFSATQILHSTLVGERAVSPSQHDPIEVRPVGIEGSHDGQPDYQFLYNVQPGSKRHEFATLSPFDWSYDTAWHCAEWHLSYAAQSYSFYIDGGEVTSIRLDNGRGRFAGTDIPPSYQSITVGWTNYRSAAVGGLRGFQAWLDDVALAPTRLGCA